MYSSLIAVGLCICAQVAAAQCVAAPDVNQQAGAPMKAHVVKTQAGGKAAPTPELIATAAAGTRHPTSVMGAAPEARTPTEERQPRRGGAAMLLAALALMSGIALRRYSAPGQ